jgi:hypothetical protein
MKPSKADLVWNRACFGGGSDLRAGDVALAALLRAHGMIMNGGVFHVFETLDGPELADAEAGYRFFGLSGAAALLEYARRVPENQRGDLESAVDAEYS